MTRRATVKSFNNTFDLRANIKIQDSFKAKDFMIQTIADALSPNRSHSLSSEDDGDCTPDVEMNKLSELKKQLRISRKGSHSPLKGQIMFHRMNSNIGSFLGCGSSVYADVDRTDSKLSSISPSKEIKSIEISCTDSQTENSLNMQDANDRLENLNNIINKGRIGIHQRKQHRKTLRDN